MIDHLTHHSISAETELDSCPWWPSQAIDGLGPAILGTKWVPSQKLVFLAPTMDGGNKFWDGPFSGAKMSASGRVIDL